MTGAGHAAGGGAPAVPDRQVPPPGRINLDHVAWFGPDREACRAALLALGFAPTPFSLQQHRTDERAPLQPAGTGNHCVMLADGYLEVLVPIASTPIADQLRAAIARYAGAHSIVFGTADPQSDRDRLEREGFVPLPPIDLQRPVDTADGERNVRFTVVRVPPGTMAEGRIQFCRHRTPGLVWQARWLDHPNRATALRGVHVCVADVDEAVRRYARFAGLGRSTTAAGARIETARGWLRFFDPETCERRLGMRPPSVPWIAGCSIATADIAAAETCLRASGTAFTRAADGTLTARAAPALGGIFVFEPA